MSGSGRARDKQGVRLQKVLAAAGVGSRRHCDDLIAAGRVRVDGKIVTELGTRVDPERATVHVDGERVVVSPTVVVVALNKPTGVVTAMRDPRGMPCVGDLVPKALSRGARLFHVGRLDADTEGLLLLTNDGDLAHRLTHPSFGVSKTYIAEVQPEMDAEATRRLRHGIVVDGRPLAVERLKIVGRREGRTALKLTIHEGRNRIVRRALEMVGRDVVALVRTEFGPVRMGRLEPGHARELTAQELDALYAAAEATSDPAPAGRSRSI